MGLLTTATVSALTAVFSVILTFFLYRKRDKINTLRAIKSEAEQNRETAETIHRHVSGDMLLRKEGKERPPSLSHFSTYAFQTAKNAGVLARLPADVRDTITKHYTLIETTNHQLEYRQRMRSTSRALSGFTELMNSLDLVIQLKLHSLGTADLSDLPVERTAEELESVNEETATFDEVIKAVDGELDDVRVLDRFL